MRWERLFADADAQWAEAERRDLEEEVSVKTRGERKKIRLVDRLRFADGRRVEVRVLGAGVLHGIVREIGADWFLMNDDAGNETLVPLASVMSVTGLPTRAAAPSSEGPLVPAMTFRHALTVVSADRSLVALTLTDAATLTGMVDRVGADTIDLSPAVPGESRGGRAAATVTIPTAAIMVVHRR